MGDKHAESAWVRAKADAKNVFSSWLFAIGAPVTALLIGAVGYLVEEHASSRSDGYRTALIVIFGVAAVAVPFLSVLFFQRVTAPGRQRDEARTDLNRTREALIVERTSQVNEIAERERLRRREFRGVLVQIIEECDELRERTTRAMTYSEWRGQEFISLELGFPLLQRHAHRDLLSIWGFDKAYSATTRMYRLAYELHALVLPYNPRHGGVVPSTPVERGSELLSRLEAELDTVIPLLHDALTTITTDPNYLPPGGMSGGVRLLGS